MGSGGAAWGAPGWAVGRQSGVGRAWGCRAERRGGMRGRRGDEACAGVCRGLAWMLVRTGLRGHAGGAGAGGSLRFKHGEEKARKTEITESAVLGAAGCDPAWAEGWGRWHAGRAPPSVISVFLAFASLCLNRGVPAARDDGPGARGPRSRTARRLLGLGGACFVRALFAPWRGGGGPIGRGERRFGRAMCESHGRIRGGGPEIQSAGLCRLHPSRGPQRGRRGGGQAQCVGARAESGHWIRTAIGSC